MRPSLCEADYQESDLGHVIWSILSEGHDFLTHGPYIVMPISDAGTHTREMWARLVTSAV